MADVPAAKARLRRRGKPKPLPTVVTFLEMTKKPAFAIRPPSNLQIALVRATAIPLHFYRYLMYRTGRPWNWVWRLRMDDDELAAIVHADWTEIMVLWLDGVPAGFFEIERVPGQPVCLSYFGLMEHALGRGLGKWFLASAIEQCWAGNPDKVTVNTCTLDHPAALPLYQKLGFAPVGRAETMIQPLCDEDHLRLARLTA